MYKPQLKDGMAYDLVVSALQRMVRRGMEREALILGETLFENNYGKALVQRLMSIAAEDIGLANPQLVAQVFGVCTGWIIAKKEAKSGYSEFLALAMCIILLSRSPKNREVDDAIVVTCRRMNEVLDSAANEVIDPQTGGWATGSVSVLLTAATPMHRLHQCDGELRGDPNVPLNFDLTTNTCTYGCALTSTANLMSAVTSESTPTALNSSPALQICMTMTRDYLFARSPAGISLRIKSRISW